MLRLVAPILSKRIRPTHANNVVKILTSLAKLEHITYLTDAVSVMPKLQVISAVTLLLIFFVKVIA